MSTTLQLFPNKTWKTAKFSIMSENHVRLNMTDDKDTKYELTMFVHGNTGSETNALAILIKEAAEKLTVNCESCGNPIKS